MRAWEPEPKESYKAFSAFKIYRDMGSGRSLEKAAISYYGARKNLAQIHVWSSKFSWVERVAAFDAWKEMIRNDAIEEYEKADATDKAQREAELREANMRNEEHAAKLEAEFLDRAEKLLEKLPLITQTAIHHDDNGNPITYILQPATKNAVLDAARLHKIATRNEPERVDVTTDGEPIEIIEYTFASPNGSHDPTDPTE